MRDKNPIHTNPLHILLGWRGVFFAVFAAFLLTACGGVSAPVSIVVNSSNSGVVDCEENPFDETCGDEYAAQRTQKINECLIEDMATEDISCAPAANAQSCLKDPFADGCDEDAGFSAFLEVAKDQREAFCNIGDNAEDTLCAGAVATFCGGNPFNSLCKADSYVKERGEIVADCITEGKAADSPCAAAVEFNPCIRNPFTPECVEETDFRTTRETFCRKDDNATNALCAGALAHFCADDPFDAICDEAAYSRQQSERTALCISDDNASNDDLCKGAIDATDVDCITDPYIAGCESKLTARAARESYCRGNTNPTLCGNAVLHICTNDPLDGLCDQMTQNMQLCTNDPFNTGCDPTTYEMQRAMRTTECITGDNASNDALCANAIADDNCILDPYDSECKSANPTLIPAQTARETYCRGNDNPTLCGQAITHFCTADPFDSICKASNFANLIGDRAMRVTACIAGDKASDADFCANAVKFNVCIRNPFTPECSTQTDAQTAREIYCRGNENLTLCAGAVVHFCAIDPFDAICDDNTYSRQQMERTALCISGDNASNDVLCAKAIADDINACIRDPFTSACNTQKVFRSIRESFCREVGNATANPTLCGNVVVHVCDSTRANADPFDGLCDVIADFCDSIPRADPDPFAGLCDGGNTYMMQRTARVTACIADDKANDDALCANAIGEDKCILDPYAEGCESTDSNPTAAQTARTTFCRDGNEGNALCASTVTHFCTIDPFDGLCDPSDYSSQRSTRLMECEKQTPDPALACTKALEQGKCNLDDPFIEGCEGQVNQQAAEEVFCRKGTNAIDPARADNCRATITRVCGADPFDSICAESNFANLIGDRATRVLACIAGDKANDDTLCANAIANNPCIRDPYGAGCDGDVDSDGDDEAQTMRETHCRAGNQNTALCAGAVVHFCTIDPYDALCNENNFDTLTTARATRVATCAIGDNASDPDLCGGAIADAAVDCITDPFTTACVGADTARTARETYCRGNVNPTLCANAIAHFCDTNTRTAADPFDGLCDEITHSVQRGDRVTACIADDKADDTTCANAVKFNACIRNPFTTECSTENVARDKRKEFCDMGNNKTNALCAGAVLHFCAIDPFDAICDDNTYSRQQSERAALCIKDDNASNDVLCAKAIADDANACIRDPFTEACSTQDVARSIRESFCRKGTNATANPTLCGKAVMHFCTADPLDGLCDQTTQNMRLCTNDPFNTGCDAETYKTERAMRVTECITGDNASNDALCANAIADDACILDPYAGGCESKADAQTARETYCRGNDNSALCGNAVMHFCTADPFDGLCDPTTYETQRDTRVTACIAGDKASDADFCANAVKFNVCIRNPFTPECSTQTDAQTARESFCRASAGNENNGLCAGAVLHFCAIDPFDDLCDDVAYSQQQMERVALCISGDNASDTPLCMGAIGQDECINNPFDTNCDSKLTARTARETFCRASAGNENNGLCAGAVLHFCTADPFDELCNATNFTPYATARENREEACIIGAKASDVAFCANAIVANPCIGDPYPDGTGCDGETDARTMREEHCRAGNEGSTLCASTVKYFCDTDARDVADPFDGLCDPATYEMQRNTRLSECETAPLNEPRCVKARDQMVQITCEDDPYVAGCEAEINARMTRENQCRMDNNRDDAALCQGAVTHFCTIDPFDSLCNATNFTRYTEARSVFEGFCRADVTPVEGVDCTNAINHFCTVDPFDSLCSVTNFTNFTFDRNTRDLLCRAGNNALGQANDEQCTGMLAHFCTIDPFDAVCNPTTYDAERTMRVAECITGDNASDGPLCARAILANTCISTPYAMGCEGETNAQTARETFCRGDPSNPSNPLCAGAVVHFCDTSATSNPFDADLCFDGTTYDDKRDERTTFCAGQTDSSLDDSFCAGAIATNPCFNNPFVRNLNDGAYLCSSEFAARREEQINKCIVGNKGQDSECINVLAGIGGCLANPFQDICEDADNLYFKDHADNARAARVAFCEIDITDHDYCFAGRMFERVLCTYNPYGSFCSDETFEGISTTLQAERTQKIIDCGDNDYDKPGSCVHVLARATAATWARGFDSPLKTQPTGGTNEFLRATNATHLDKGASSTTGAILNLATSTFDYNAFGGDATDGVEFFKESFGRDTYYYAGILGAADLGEPLSGDVRTMYWNGRISSTSSTESGTEGDVIVATDFILTITFDGSGGTLTSFAKVFLNDSENNDYYNINATFNERGLITDGTVVYAEFTGGDENSRVDSSLTDDDATLSGIIGEEGALGVFQGAGFAGGFVVHPTIKARVETRDWVRGFGDTAPVRIPTEENQFLQEQEVGTDGLITAPTTITDSGGGTPVVERLTLNIDRTIFNDVSWFSGFINGTQYHYAGLSRTAYLGEPLNVAPSSGTWYGKFGVGEDTTDFALDVTFATGKIGAFVRESAGIYYLLAGDFNSAGVIKGTVNYGAFANGDRTDADAITRGTNGTLTGLIGQGGVLGAFHSTATGAAGYAGGFWAGYVGLARVEVDPFALDVDYDDWKRSFLPLAVAPTAQNQFLGAVNGISTDGTRITNGGSTVPTASTLDLMTATNFDNEALGGVNTNRVDWFSGYIGSTQYHYAGVFEDADLGDPLTETPAGGEWRGRIGVGGADTDFTLTVTYGSAGGTISAFVRDTTDVYYLLEGGFDANGLIDGTVKYGEFTNPSTAVGNTEDGVLTGLIGMEGALGVFHSTATGAAGYSGGFVVRPNAPEYTVAVKYSDYRRSFLTLASPDTTSPKNQFVTDATGVMTEQNGGTLAPQTTLALDTTTFDGVALAGVAGNSLFWFDGFVDNTPRTYYAGLDTTADLGAPISGELDMTVNWRGVFGVGTAKTDFMLEITYGTGGGLISAFIRELEDNYYLLAGDFDASGLITGTVNYGAFANGDRTDADAITRGTNGILTGLIGAEGAIGAFYSDDTGVTGYSGGFVARDNVAAFDDATVRYETWTRGFLLADTPDVSKPRNQFLRALTNTLDIAGNNNSITINLNTAKFNAEAIDGLATNSYQSFDRTIDGTSRHYLGILPDTDLGGRVPNVATTKATWYGNFRGGFDGALAHTTDFVLHLTFDGTGGELTARANYRNTDYYTLAGNFDAGGVITGTVAYTTGFEIDPTSNGILTGIIGANGAIGVFYGEDNSRNYGGGFVAKPKTLTFTDSVKYSDWIARANPDLIPSLTPTAKNQFLQTTNKDISTMGTTPTAPRILSLSSTLFDDAPILGDKDDGVAYFTGTIGGTAYAYAGIFDSTDLGAPLTQSVTWNGVIGFNSVEKPKSTDFTITFTGKGGTITAFLANIIATEGTMDENDFLISGTFDDLGLITGTVNYAEYTADLATGMILNIAQAGVLSGIIGQDGAVGVFHSTAAGANAYSGGFITSADVKEQVNISTWRDSFTGAGLYTTPDEITTPQNQFLDGAGLSSDYRNVTDRSGGFTATIFTLGLGSKSGAAEATYKSIPLGGDNAGGIGYFQGFQRDDPANINPNEFGEPDLASRLYYGYLNNASKIGTRIEDTTGEAEYHGQFRAWAITTGGDVFNTNTDFTLTVSFGTSVRGDAGDIDAFVAEARNSGRYYRLFGTYDSNGVIKGEVEYGTFLNTNPLLWVEDGSVLEVDNGRTGFFSGIISEDNAMGVFISGSALEERGLLTAGRGNDGFAGGFIARRFVVDDSNPNVGYTDWARWFNHRARADTLTPKNQFLTTFGGINTDGTTAQPADITTVTLSDVDYEPVTTTGDVNDGFSYFLAGNYGYTGILDSTDLGAPLRGFNGTKATWHGQLNFRNAEHDFFININYGSGGGTVAGFLANIVDTTDFALEGSFGANGVITGRTNFAQYTNDIFDGMAIDTPNGILTGIIGQEGVVGVFHSTALGADGYVGGFVVHPQAVDVADVNYNDWIRGKSYLTDPTDRSGSHFLTTTDGVISRGTTDAELSDITYLTLNNATLGLTKNVVKIPIPESPLDFTTRSVDNPVMVEDYEILKNTFEGVPIGGDANDGIAYYEAEGNTYAGILDSTNLGKPLTQTTGKLNWHGQLHLTANFDNATNNIATYTRDFVLTITFNSTGGTLEGVIQELDDSRFNNPNQVRIEDYLAYERDFNLSEATFDTNGVITGKAIYRSANVGKSSISFGNRVEQVGTLTGLIGQEGAVAVFNNGNISTTSTRWSGGFVVQPNVLGTVTYADWVRANPAPLIEKQFNGVVTPFVESGTDPDVDNLPGIFDVPLAGSHFLTTKNGVISRGSKDPGHSFIREVGTVNRHITEENPDNRVAREATYVRFGKGNDIGDGTIGGFAYYTGFISTREPLSDGGRVSVRETVQSYTGILDDTNLGAPLTETTGTTAQWKGQIGYSDFVSGGFYNLVVPFDLNITYTDTGGKIDAFIMNIGESNPATFLENTEFYLEGTFDLRGVIYGYTLLENRADAAAAASRLRAIVNAEIYDLNSYEERGGITASLGILTGLIGEKGAVGVWYRPNPDSSGSGGFIAAPSAPVMEHYKAWQASFASTPATTITSAENRFLSDSDNIFDNLRTEPNGGATPAPITTLNMDANVNNSVSFANGYFNNAGNTIRSFHATIGVDADLGAVLPVWQTGQTASAMWNGKFRAESGNGTTTNVDFDLAVDFENRAVEAFVPITPASITHYHLRGEFPAHLKGAIIGTVDRGDFTDSNRLLPTGDNTPGVFTGLIGSQGAIGVFISGSRVGTGSALIGGTGDTGYAGGFVANP